MPLHPFAPEDVTHSGTGLLSHVVVKATTARRRNRASGYHAHSFQWNPPHHMEAFDIDQRDLGVAQFQEFSR
jgi:hypothetical protein